MVWQLAENPASKPPDSTLQQRDKPASSGLFFRPHFAGVDGMLAIHGRKLLSVEHSIINIIIMCCKKTPMIIFKNNDIYKYKHGFTYIY